MTIGLSSKIENSRPFCNLLFGNIFTGKGITHQKEPTRRGKPKWQKTPHPDSPVCMKQSMPKLLWRFQNDKLQIGCKRLERQRLIGSAVAGFIHAPTQSSCSSIHFTFFTLHVVTLCKHRKWAIRKGSLWPPCLCYLVNWSTFVQ